MGEEDELVELFEKARKAAEKASKDVAGGADEARCLDAIRAMHVLPVTTSLLMSTKVGKQLRSLTKHSRPQIQRASMDLLDIWKKTVAVEAKNGCMPSSEGGTSKSTSEVKVEKVIHVKPQTKLQVVSRQIVEKVNPIPAYTSVKLSSIPKTNESTRDKIRELLAEALGRVSSEADVDDLKARSYDPVRAAVTVETVMFEKLGLSRGVNKLKYRSIMFNMKDSNNPDLRRRVLVGEVRPEQLVNMTPEEMASDE
eukprot:c18625_g2_i1 orf=2-760(-)